MLSALILEREEATASFFNTKNNKKRGKEEC